MYSAYAPQLASRLHISSTTVNLIGLAGNFGMYTSGPMCVVCSHICYKGLLDNFVIADSQMGQNCGRKGTINVCKLPHPGHTRQRRYRPIQDTSS